MAVRCAYCHTAFAGGAEASCPGCATLLHDDCAREAGACPTLGCAGRPVEMVKRPFRAYLITGVILAVLYMLAPALATKVRFENRSGRRLEDVELQFCNEDWRPWSPLQASVMEPGESIELRVYHPLPIIALHEARYVLDGDVVEPTIGGLVFHGAVLAVQPSGQLTCVHPDPGR